MTHPSSEPDITCVMLLLKQTEVTALRCPLKDLSRQGSSGCGRAAVSVRLLFKAGATEQMSERVQLTCPKPNCVWDTINPRPVVSPLGSSCRCAFSERCWSVTGRTYDCRLVVTRARASTAVAKQRLKSGSCGQQPIHAMMIDWNSLVG